MQGITLLTEIEGHLFNLTLKEFYIGKQHHGFHSLNVATNNVSIFSRYYRSPAAQHAIIFVGDVGGAWNSPIKMLYPRLGEHLVVKKISSLILSFRYPHRLGESVLDVLAGIMFLQSQGVTSISLVGHGFAGSVIVQAASLSESVEALVLLASENPGQTAISELKNKPLLLLHGSKDTISSVFQSQYIHTIAMGPKELVIYQGARHNLHEVTKEMYFKICEWLSKNFTKPQHTYHILS